MLPDADVAPDHRGVVDHDSCAVIDPQATTDPSTPRNLRREHPLNHHAVDQADGNGQKSGTIFEGLTNCVSQPIGRRQNRAFGLATVGVDVLDDVAQCLELLHDQPRYP